MTKKQLEKYLDIMQELPKAYKEARLGLAEYLQGKGPLLPGGHKGEGSQLRVYEQYLSLACKDILRLISKSLCLKHKIKGRKSVLQFNSVHKKIKGRLSIPWNANIVVEDDWSKNQKDWACDYFNKVNSSTNDPRSNRDMLVLQPDKPSHLLTEILWRFDSNWIGILKNKKRANRLSENSGYLWGINKKGRKAFTKDLKKILNVCREKNSANATVDLGEEYNDNDIEKLTLRAYEWLYGNSLSVDNIFFFPDAIESEQLAGVAMELIIPRNAKYRQIDTFIEDCQWLLNRYIYSLILNVEKTYSLSETDTIYSDAYFYKQKDTKGADANEETKSIQTFSDFFAHPDRIYANTEIPLNEKFSEAPFITYKSTLNLFKKLRIHFSLAAGTRGTLIRGYKKHAYEVACTVAGIIDVLFEFGEFNKSGVNRPSVEAIIRQSDSALDGIDDKFEKAKIPFLFRQLFKGLSKEDQLFLIPQYRDHFIHSFYVFIFGLVLMCDGPEKTIPPKLMLKRFNDKKEFLKLLQKWFLVSMCHDIAYMVQKGNVILEQHITSFFQATERSEGVLPWHPSLGNLMQVERLLDEIRDLSKNSIYMCDTFKRAITDSHNSDMANKLLGDIIVATAFERRDHGIWSALMFNHAWDVEMCDLFSSCDKTAVLDSMPESDKKIKIIKKIFDSLPADQSREPEVLDNDANMEEKKKKRLLRECLTVKNALLNKDKSDLNNAEKNAIKIIQEIEHEQIEISKLQRKEIAKAIMPHHLADWDIKKILKSYHNLNNCTKGRHCCGHSSTSEFLGKSEECNQNNSKCQKPFATVSYKENELGYLLGLCDIISQAGREAPELSKYADKKGITYGPIVKLDGDDTESLQLHVNYSKTDKIGIIIKKYFAEPAQFLGLTVQSADEGKTKSLQLKIGKTRRYFYNEALNEEK